MISSLKLEQRVSALLRSRLPRSYGSFQRSLRIPDTVDEEKIEARFDKGILKVTLPKRTEAASEQRKIEIKKS